MATSQTDKGNQNRKSLKEWFASQDYKAKLTAVLLFKLSDADHGDNDLAGDILNEFESEILNQTEHKISQDIERSALNGTIRCLLAR